MLSLGHVSIPTVLFQFPQNIVTIPNTLNRSLLSPCIFLFVYPPSTWRWLIWTAEKSSSVQYWILAPNGSGRRQLRHLFEAVGENHKNLRQYNVNIKFSKNQSLGAEVATEDGQTHSDVTSLFNHLTPNDHYSGRTAPLTSKHCIFYIYSTNIGTEYFKHGIYSQPFSLQNSGCFIILTHLVPVLFTFYIQVC